MPSLNVQKVDAPQMANANDCYAYADKTVVKIGESVILRAGCALGPLPGNLRALGKAMAWPVRRSALTRPVVIMNWVV
ncbi:hypothetical protein [Parachitinimonas caeni]|uniref:Uncharacterized protein n=1 Tax=Parachitinimonas caeni TaxID=3031301 RepID=A0ABT7E6B3_9NEIS|nr:hypothetical protein [Parachitinimonas caeni]MDK2126462.1 hypothetical protein [Parachitinimonas caeni]